MAFGRERRLDAFEERLGGIGELLAQHEKASDLTRFERWADDPVGFIKHELHGDPWDAQVRIAKLVRDHPFVAVRSCNGAGKDWLAARLALWWAYAKRGFVILTVVRADDLREGVRRVAKHLAETPSKEEVRS